MIRRIIKIDEEKCNGCGACATACHEGAIEIIDGIAKVAREDFCDGLGDCLPACPKNAVSFEEREAPAYNEEAVKQAKLKNKEKQNSCGCPGARAKAIKHNAVSSNAKKEHTESRLSQWPVQIKLVPVNAPYFDECNLLVAADCTAYAYASFHEDFIKERITLIGCPKLDDIDYAEKLTHIIESNNILTVTVVRMEVPCCGGLENAVIRAISESGKCIPLNVITLTVNGEIQKN